MVGIGLHFENRDGRIWDVEERNIGRTSPRSVALVTRWMVMSFPGHHLSHQNVSYSKSETWCVLVITALGHGGLSSESPCPDILLALWPLDLPQLLLAQPVLCRQQNSA